MPNDSTKEPPTLEELKEALSAFRLKLGATLQQIKKRKGFLTKITHEDVVAGDLKEQAREEMIQINAAWEVIDAWFKANPGQTATPTEDATPGSAKSESKTSTGDASGNDPDFDDEDPEDWNNWKSNVQNRWTGQTSSLEQLDEKRRRDLIINARREFVMKVKVGVGVAIAIGFCLMPASTIGFFSLWNLTVIAYLLWLFLPKAKQATEKWIQME